MIELITMYRLLNIYSHHAHNMCKGDEFFQDHDFFAGLYATADNFYDACIERHIGTVSDKLSILNIMVPVNKSLISMSDDYMSESLKLIEKIIKEIDSLTKSGKLSIGTQNLIAGQADELEIISYKIKRRILEDEVV